MEGINAMKYTIKDLVRVSICSALTGLLALIIVPLPFTPVPISAQTLGVMVSGLVLSPKFAALSQIIYILLGLLGLPIFSGGQSGIGTLMGPTGGYIIGFIPAAFIISLLLKTYKPQTTFGYFLIISLGANGAIYLLGVFQLVSITKITFKQALISGVFPFLIGDLFKALLGAGLAKHRSSSILRE